MRSLNSLIPFVALLLCACGASEQDGQVSAEPAEVVEVEPTEGHAERASSLQPVDNASRPMPPNSAAAESGNANMSWSYSRAADGPKLVYGEAETDNVRLMLRCDDGETLLSFVRPASAAEGKPETITLASGGATRSLTLETRPGQLGTTVEAQVPASAAALDQFRSGKPMELRWGEDIVQAPAPPADARDQFFEACE